MFSQLKAGDARIASTGLLDELRRESRQANLWWFVNIIVPLCYPGEDFVFGPWLKERVDWIDQNPWILWLAPRGHAKTSIVFWKILKILFDNHGANAEMIPGLWLGHNPVVSRRPVKKLRLLIEANPLFGPILDFKQSAEAIAEYAWPETPNMRLSLVPHSMQVNFRGEHTKLLITDDVLGDVVDNLALNPLKVLQTNQYMEEKVYHIAEPAYNNQGEPFGVFINIGTPQSRLDFFFKKSWQTFCSFRHDRAINKDGSPAWPEKWSQDRIDQAKSVGEKSWSKEMLCIPIAGTEAYFKEKNIKMAYGEPPEIEVGDVLSLGWDPAEEEHNSVVTIYIHRGPFAYQFFLLKYEPGTKSLAVQFDEVVAIGNRYGVHRGYVDGTRGEFNLFEQNKMLPKWMRIITLTSGSGSEKAKPKKKLTKRLSVSRSGIMAALELRLDPLKVGGQTIQLLDDDDQLASFLNLNNQLESFVIDGDHGDYPWASAFATAYKPPRRSIVDLG